MNDQPGDQEEIEKLRTPEQLAARAFKNRKKQRKRFLTLVAITLAVFLSWLGSTIFVTSHNVVAQQFQTSHLTVTLTLSSYSIALIMIAIAGGRICDIVGRKRMFLIAGSMYVITGLVGATVDNLWSLLIVRILMGSCAALILTSTGGILVTTMHGTTRHDAWLLWRGAGMSGMVLGPVIGPIISTQTQWRLPFLFDASLMLVALALGAYAMKESRDTDSTFTLGLLFPTMLLGLGILSPYLAILAAKNQVANWSLVFTILIAGVACIGGFLILNRKASNKLFDTNIVLHNRRMWLTDIFGAIHVGALFVVVAAFTVILDADTNLSSVWIGIGLLPLVVPLISLHLAAHRFREKHGLTRQKETLIGCVLLGLSMTWWFFVGVQSPSYLTVLPSLILAGAGFGLIRLYGHMGVIKETGQRWSSTLFGTRTFSNHMGAGFGAVVVGFVLASASIGANTLEPEVGRQAGVVAGLAILLVIVSSAVFAWLKSELLGLEDPHWNAAAHAIEGTEPIILAP